jgi:hypothetical protein
MFKYEWFCVGWAFTWQASIRLSIFLVAVLSISRTVSLVYPFYKIRRKTIMIPVCCYLMLILGQQILPMVAGKSFWYARRLSMCTWLLTDVVAINTTEFKVLHFTFITMEYVVPAFPIVISCIITVWLLSQRKKFSTPAGFLLKSEATKTIIYLTLAYIFFNAPLIIVCILESITVLSDFRFQIQHFGLPVSVVNFIYTLIGNHSVALNSTTNVVIYFCRKEGLRKFCRKVLTFNWKELTTEGATIASSKKLGLNRTLVSSRNNTIELSTVMTPKGTSPVFGPHGRDLDILKKQKSVRV